MSASKRKVSSEVTTMESFDYVKDPPAAWYMDYYSLNGGRLPRIHLFFIRSGKKEFVDIGVVHVVDEDMNSSGIACIEAEFSKGRKYLLHPAYYEFSEMSTLSEDSMLSRGWYAEPEETEEVTTTMIIRHFHIVNKTLDKSRSPNPKKARRGKEDPLSTKEAIVVETSGPKEAVVEGHGPVVAETSGPKEVVVEGHGPVVAETFGPNKAEVEGHGPEEPVVEENENSELGDQRAQDRGKSIENQETEPLSVKDRELLAHGSQVMASTSSASQHSALDVLKTIPQVDTKKMQKQFEGKEKIGMAGLVNYAKYYPLGLSCIREVLVDQCDLAPDQYICRPLSPKTVSQLVVDFGGMPKPCSFAADLMPYDPRTNKCIRLADFKREKVFSYRYWILGGQHSIMAARVF